MFPAPAILSLVLCLGGLAFAGPARAEAVSLLGRGSTIFAPAPALVVARADTGGTGGGGSLFAGRSGTSLFAPLAPRAQPIPAAPILARALAGTRIEKLRGIIGHAESRRDGYDAVQHGASVKPPRIPTEMTIAEILAWVDATPGQPHAIGRFQFIPPTLRRVVEHVGLPGTARFTPEVQDRLADVLLAEAGLQAAADGRLGRHAFMNNLAKIWAGLPTTGGQSHYHGHAGNRAAMSWADYEAAMTPLFPDPPA